MSNRHALKYQAPPDLIAYAARALRWRSKGRNTPKRHQLFTSAALRGQCGSVSDLNRRCDTERPNMETKLRQCPLCKEWFNATSSVMIEHYRLKHSTDAGKAFITAELIFKFAYYNAKAKYAPFPESMQHTLAALTVAVQINAVSGSSMKWPTV